jgi:hypothetical protein
LQFSSFINAQLAPLCPALQHASIMEENRQLWGAVAHINATLHAGRAAMLSEAFQQQQQEPLPASQHTAPLGQAPTPATATTAGGISPTDLEDVFASPDPMCLAEACGMLFSPAPATAKLLAGQQATASAAGTAPVSKARKLFAEELAAVACCGGAMGPEPEGLALLGDLPKLDFVH